MTVGDNDKVDGLGTDRVTGETVLLISDHLPWDDRHFQTLEAKLAAYVRFVESGQLLEVRPGADPTKVVISLLAKFRPPPSAVMFLEQAGIALQQRGFKFKFGPIPTDGYDDHAG